MALSWGGHGPRQSPSSSFAEPRANVSERNSPFLYNKRISKRAGGRRRGDPLGFRHRQSKVLKIPAGLGSVPPVPGLKCPKSRSASAWVGLGHGCKHRFLLHGAELPNVWKALCGTLSHHGSQEAAIKSSPQGSREGSEVPKQEELSPVPGKGSTHRPQVHQDQGGPHPMEIPVCPPHPGTKGGDKSGGTLPSGRGVTAMTRRLRLGTGTAQMSLPSRCSRGSWNVISYLWRIFRNPTCGGTRVGVTRCHRPVPSAPPWGQGPTREPAGRRGQPLFPKSLGKCNKAPKAAKPTSSGQSPGNNHPQALREPRPIFPAQAAASGL